MCGALVRCRGPRGVHRRLAEVLEPSGGTSFTGGAGQDPDARAARPGQAEAVITSGSGLGTPRWRSASAWAWPTVAATPEEPPVSSTGRVQGRGGVRPGWLQGDAAGARPGVVLLDPLRDHALAGTRRAGDVRQVLTARCPRSHQTLYAAVGCHHGPQLIQPTR